MVIVDSLIFPIYYAKLIDDSKKKKKTRTSIEYHFCTKNNNPLANSTTFKYL